MNLGDNWAFANSIYSKFKRDSQYQAESVLDWAAHLEHLQPILLEYNPVEVSTKPTMLRYFREGLKPSVLAKLEHRDLELETFDQIVKKAVNAKAKSAFQSCSSTKEIYQNCSCGKRSANFTITKSQSCIMKDPLVEKSKVWGLESLGPQYSKSSEKAWKEKKKE